MSEIVRKQLLSLKDHPYITDTGAEIDGEYSKIIFAQKSSSYPKSNMVRITFKSYFITGFDGFDFHDKYNNGIAPPEPVMKAEVLKETEKMYYVKAQSETSEKMWVGWVPKKSCTVREM